MWSQVVAPSDLHARLSDVMLQVAMHTTSNSQICGCLPRRLEPPGNDGPTRLLLAHGHRLMPSVRLHLPSAHIIQRSSGHLFSTITHSAHVVKGPCEQTIRMDGASTKYKKEMEVLMSGALRCACQYSTVRTGDV